MELDFDRCYRAVASRDQRFDGWFCTAVTSTGIYCRPSCSAQTPKPQHLRFLPTAASAQRAGFRACLRCRPDAAPGSPEWDIRADVTGRAMRLIADGVADREGVGGLASRLGYTQRHLHRLLVGELGAGPLALARAQRAQTARTLIETTDLGLAEIAFAAGFGSVRQFNDTILAVYGRQPSTLRAPSTQRGASGRRAQGAAALPAGTITLRLPYRAPLHAEALLEFLAARAVPGVEAVDQDGYHRRLRLPHGLATVTLAPHPGHIQATLRLVDVRDLTPAVARCRRLLDLDADPEAVDAVLAADPALAPAVAKEPGVRVPRAVSGFEMAVRAIVGQQISVSAARRVLTALLPAPPDGPDRPDAAHPPGALVSAFPEPEQVLALPDQAFAMPAARRATVRALAAAVADGSVRLDGDGERGEIAARLTALPGIGPWTAGYIAMRALGDPDVLLPTDLGVRRGAAALGLPDHPATLLTHATRWSPWRSYAVVRLWRNA